MHHCKYATGIGTNLLCMRAQLQVEAPLPTNHNTQYNVPRLKTNQQIKCEGHNSHPSRP